MRRRASSSVAAARHVTGALSLPIDERERSWINATGANAADDAVVMARKHLVHVAVKKGETVLQDRCARERGRL
jgi:stage V sporulation protein SpoVS